MYVLITALLNHENIFEPYYFGRVVMFVDDGQEKLITHTISEIHRWVFDRDRSGVADAISNYFFIFLYFDRSPLHSLFEIYYIIIMHLLSVFFFLYIVHRVIL